MKYLLLRDEESVADIANRAFKKLSIEDRVKVEAALLKANPELKSIRNLRKGALIRVPPLVEAMDLNRRNLVDPVGVISDDLIGHLKALEARFKNDFADRERQLNEHSKILTSAIRELKKHPAGEVIRRDLTKHLKDAKATVLKDKKQELEALKKLRKSAATIDR